MSSAGRPTTALLAAVLAISTAAQPAIADEVVIGTGSSAGVYFHAGRAICRLINRNASELQCRALASAGSLFNLGAVRDGALELGIAQSDWQYQAVKGTGQFEFAGQDFGVLRSVFSLHGEPFTLVARRDSGIVTLDDLLGRRINIGNPGSGQRATMEVVLQAMAWKKSQFALITELPADQQSLALCHGRIEAMVYTVGHPNASVSKAAGLCDAIMVEVSGTAIDRLVEANPFYAYTTIPGGMYSGNPEPVTTFGVKATVVSSSDVPATVIYQAVQAVFDDLERLRRMHPAFASLDPRRMVSDGLSAPLHEGAQRYYRERGLLE